MPEQEVAPSSQILYVGVIGPKQCGNCDYMIKELGKRGIQAKKEILDNNNPLHQKLRDEAAKKGEKEAPIVYTIKAGGEPNFIGAGRGMIHILRVAGREKDAQDERAQQETMANA